jgi:RNA polymerase sigma-70 factor (ECF subfamily)
MSSSTTNPASSAAEAVARRSYGKLVALLAARTGDVAAAEDALSEAFTAALTTWPEKGCPDNPEAWLLTVARRKTIDAARSRLRGDSAAEQLQLIATGPDTDMEIPDQRLALLFTCAHPAIDAAVHTPLMLQTVLGLDAKRIAQAFLTSPSAMGKRLVRAKEKIREACIPFRIPEPEELPGRLAAVLSAAYAAYGEGWSETDRDLTEEAIFLARITVELLPREPEALGLLALMLHAQARHRARRSREGEYVPFAEQDLALWDWPMIEEAESLLRQAGTFRSIGRYQLESALQSAHVHRRRTSEDNWPDVLQLYDALFALTDSPVVAVNRALAVAEVEGATAGLAAIEEAAMDPRVAQYQPYWAARAELLAKTDAREEARQAYEMAIGLERDPAIRRFLQKRQNRIVR